MRKATLSLFVLLIVFSIHSYGQIPQWKVIKEWHASGVTTPIPQTVVFTPQLKGLYRVSVYFAGFVSSPQDTSWGAAFSWTDLTGVLGAAFVGVSFGSGSNFSTAGPQIFSPLPGTPVNVVVEPSTPPPTDSSYDYALTIEKLAN